MGRPILRRRFSKLQNKIGFDIFSEENKHKILKRLYAYERYVYINELAPQARINDGLFPTP